MITINDTDKEQMDTWCLHMWKPTMTYILFQTKEAKPESNHEKTLDKHKLRNTLQNSWPVLFKIVKTEDKAEKWSQIGKTAMTWQLQSRILDQNLEQKKGVSRKTDKIWINSILYVIVLYQG